MDETIPKKTAALEVHRHLNSHKIALLLSVAGYFIIVLCTVASRTVASFAALLLTGISGFFLYRTVSEMRRLEFQYGIDPPKPMFQKVNLK